MPTLSRPSGPLEVRVVATDLDRTLTDERLEPVPAALGELARVRSLGAKVILCTGRAQAELPPALSAGLFDALVLEGGAVVGLPGDLRPAAAPDGWHATIEAWLEARGIPYILGEAYVSVLAEEVGLVAALAKHVPVTYHLNRDRVDITPPGIDKGSGLRAAMALCGATGPVLAFGDSDNDTPLLAAADHRVAVANAVDALKATAHEVTQDFGGRGVAKFLATRVR